MNKQNKNITAERIQQRLATLHMTQRELAEKTGKTETTISRWVNGSRTPFATDYPILSKVLQCTCDYLLGLSSIPTKTGIQEANDKMLLEVLKRECEKYPLCMKRCELCKTNRMIEKLESTEREENQ